MHPLLKDYMSVILFQLEHDKGVNEENEKKFGLLKQFSESSIPQTVPEEGLLFLVFFSMKIFNLNGYESFKMMALS